MDILDDFNFKQKKYIPTFPKASGNPTVYIEGYPFEDDEPMAATGFHGEQISTFYHQFSTYFDIDPHIHIGIDSFIYYREGDITKFVAPDIFVVFGVAKNPLRRSFYTWAEGAVPTAVFEFLSDSTAHHDRDEKVSIYLKDIGVQEYFIHQPEMDKPSEFCGWERNSSGDIMKIEQDVHGGIFSKALNLWLRWEEQEDTHVRLLRPFLPDGTPITTPKEDKHLLIQAEAKAVEETERRQELEAEIEKLQAQLAESKNLTK